VKNLSRALPLREQGRRNRRTPLSFLEKMKSFLDAERKKKSGAWKFIKRERI
jgi:hypothetical protein